MSSSCLLGLGCDFNSQLNRTLEGFTSSLINRFHRLNIDTGDHQRVGREKELRTNFVGLLVNTENSLSNNLGRTAMERIKSRSSNCTSNTRSNSLTSITDKIRHSKHLGTLSRVGAIDIKIPVVSELELKTGVIRSFDSDLVSHKVRSKKKAKGLEGTLSLWGVTRKVQDSEFLISTQQHKVRTKNNSSPLCFVIVNLDRRIVGRAVGNNLGLLSHTTGRLITGVTLLL
mmetsp:Transcript_376/g.540  ORF Transcript_376/g.540 Transcript_376/m.540 type:complete len:229 (+) Transcript_376:625-1311(+)